MSKYSRHSPVIKTNDQEDYWAKEFEKNLNKSAVQPRSEIFDEINSIMNSGNSRFSSVQAKVTDMMERSGLTLYLKATEQSKSTKTASQDIADSPEFKKALETIKKATDNLEEKKSKLPNVLQQRPEILKTLENIVQDSRGHFSINQIVNKLQSLHKGEIANDGDWADGNLLRFISKLNMAAKLSNPQHENNSNLGKLDFSNEGSPVGNTDFFAGLLPTKI